MHVPIYSDPKDPEELAEALRVGGLVVIDGVRPTMAAMARRVALALGIAPDGEGEGADFMLHLATDVDPIMEHGWIDYLVYGRTFPCDPMRAKGVVCDAVRQWGEAGKPDYFIAELNLTDDEFRHPLSRSPCD